MRRISGIQYINSYVLEDTLASKFYNQFNKYLLSSYINNLIFQGSQRVLMGMYNGLKMDPWKWNIKLIKIIIHESNLANLASQNYTL